MSNREKGEVSAVIAGTSYTFVNNHNAMIAAEEAASTPEREVTWDEFQRLVLRGSAKAFRIFMWAMLRKYHPEVTLDETSRLIDEAGGPMGLKAVLEAGAKAATPDDKDVQAVGAKRPRVAQAKETVGESTTSQPAESA